MTLPMLALSMVAMTAMVGIAIDTARMQIVQSKLQSSLDAAGLAAGSTVSTSNLNSEVTKYLNTNFNGYLGAVLTGSSATVDSHQHHHHPVGDRATADHFYGAVGINTITVKANSQISRAVSGWSWYWRSTTRDPYNRPSAI